METKEMVPVSGTLGVGAVSSHTLLQLKGALGGQDLTVGACCKGFPTGARAGQLCNPQAADANAGAEVMAVSA